MMADCVAKVGNRTAPKFPRKSIFGHSCGCKVLQCRYEGPWSFLYETMWSLISPRAKRISGPRKFRSSPKKDFCNNICTFETCRRRQQCLFTGVDRKSPAKHQTRAFDPCETFKRVDLWAKVLTQGPRRLMPPKNVDFNPPLPSGCCVLTARGTIQSA